MGKFIKVASKNEIPSGQAKAVDADGKKIAVFNVNNQYFAIDDECTHAGGPLSEGSLEGKTVVCPWHGASFDITSGEVLGEPADEGVKSYKVIVEGDDIKVDVG